jgi:hypothetical protein
VSERPKVMRYCTDEDQLYRELKAARSVSTAMGQLYEALRTSRHHTALHAIGRAITEARLAHSALETHCEYYFGPPTDAGETKTGSG